jgi:hypothetical protein
LEKEDVINQLEHAMELASCMRMWAYHVGTTIRIKESFHYF